MSDFRVSAAFKRDFDQVAQHYQLDADDLEFFRNEVRTRFAEMGAWVKQEAKRLRGEA